jgi:diketogulonate reductase-like aldo/keto reductase
MERADSRVLGKTGVTIPTIGMGTWGIGGYGVKDPCRDKEAVEALQHGIELGMWLIDTAEMYGAGHVEELVGQAIRAFPREKVFIISKVLNTHLEYEEVIKACHRSLERLQTDFIDLYLVHFPSYRVPLEETMGAMENLVEQGLARFIGVSNFPLSLMKQAQGYLNKTEIQANEVKYNLKCRYDERDLLPYCQKGRITVIAYTPLEEGSLANNKLLQEVGIKYGKTAAQIALNWLVCKESVVAIPKAMNFRHLEENAAAMGWRLGQEDFERLCAAFAS